MGWVDRKTTSKTAVQNNEASVSKGSFRKTNVLAFLVGPFTLLCTVPRRLRRPYNTNYRRGEYLTLSSFECVSVECPSTPPDPCAISTMRVVSTSPQRVFTHYYALMGRDELEFDVPLLGVISAACDEHETSLQ